MPLLPYEPAAQALWARMIEAHRLCPKPTATMKSAYRNGLLDAWCTVTGDPPSAVMEALTREIEDRRP
jgi:hypothetical protein